MRLIGSVALVLAVLSGNASANSLYDLTLGPDATGSITTDGNTGILTTPDIVGFNITITQGGVSTNLSYPLTGGSYGTDPATTAFTATSAGLFFDFNAPSPNNIDQYLIFQNNGSLLCFNGAAGNCNGAASQLAISNSGGFTFTVETGNVQIASSVSVVPLPSTWGMMLMGLIGLGFIGYRQKSNRALMAT